MLVFRIYITVCLLAFAWQPAQGQRTTDTLRIYFDLGNPALTQKSTASIDKWLYNDLITPRQNILIVGYADHLGADTANNELSENRAANVQDYLVNMGIDKTHIKLMIGKGEVKRKVEKADGYPTDRRVDIILLGNRKLPDPPAIKPAAPGKAPEISIATTKPGQTFVLDNIYFYTGRHFITEESIPALDRLYRALVDNPKVKIQIEGHVCCINRGPDAMDEDTMEMALSVNRAKHIYEYLAKRGISTDRLQYRGFGKTRPLVEKERTPEDESKNRRVEIRVLAN